MPMPASASNRTWIVWRMIVSILLAPFRLALWLVLAPLRIAATITSLLLGAIPTFIMMGFAFSLGFYWRDLAPYIETAKQLAQMFLSTGQLGFGALATFSRLASTAFETASASF